MSTNTQNGTQTTQQTPSTNNETNDTSKVEEIPSQNRPGRAPTRFEMAKKTVTSSLPETHEPGVQSRLVQAKRSLSTAQTQSTTQSRTSTHQPNDNNTTNAGTTNTTPNVVVV